jgi:hypothetical protein
MIILLSLSRVAVSGAGSFQFQALLTESAITPAFAAASPQKKEKQKPQR